ncbi:hypothetical protein GCM10011325_09640 [Dyadobacter sediminis]|nr:hypothetical protein GCM10011325_09640 [Dyadobacter sediminis]
MSVILFAFVLLTTFPKYLEILADPSPFNTYSYFFHKVNEPLKAVQIAPDTHGGKIAFRLTVPLLAKVLFAGDFGSGRRIVFLYLIQSFLLIPFFYVLIRLLKRFTNSSTLLYFSIACSSVYLSKAFFWDYDFWFDGFAYFFLLLGMYFRNKTGIFCALQLACWTDERAVIALFSIYLFHLLQENNFSLSGAGQLFNQESFKKPSFIVILAGLTYGLTRILLAYRFDLHTPYGEGSGVALSLIPYQFKHRLIGIFLAFEGLWLLLLSAALIMYNQRRSLLLLLLTGILILHIIVAYSVFDITRSLSYAFPVFIISGIYVSINRTQVHQRIFLITAALCLLMPTQFLIYFPRQIPWTILSYTEIKKIYDSSHENGEGYISGSYKK